MRLFADEVARDLNYFRHASHAADEHQFVDVPFTEVRVLQTCLYRWDGPLEQIIAELLQLRARQFFLNVLRSARVRCDERQVDFVFLRR